MKESAPGPAIGGAAAAPGMPAVQHLLTRAVRELGAAGGAAWRDAGGGGMTLLAQHGLGRERIDLIHESWTGHRQLLQRVLATGEPQLVQAGVAPRARDGADANGPQRPVTLLLAAASDGPTGSRQVIELFLADDVPHSTANARLQSLQQMCGAFTAAAAAAGAPLDALEFAAICRRMHAPSTVGPTAEAIVDALREWCRCDRVSVLERRGRRCRLLAVSDAGQFDPRAEAVRVVERLAVLDDLEDAGGDYQDAVQKVMAQLGRSGGSDVKKAAKEAAKELSTLMTDLGSANKSLVKMVREIRSSKDGPVDKHQLQSLQGAINPVLRFLKDTASKKLGVLEADGKTPGLKDSDLYDKKLFDGLADSVKGLRKVLPAT